MDESNVVDQNTSPKDKLLLEWTNNNFLLFTTMCVVLFSFKAMFHFCCFLIICLLSLKNGTSTVVIPSRCNCIYDTVDSLLLSALSCTGILVIISEKYFLVALFTFQITTPFICFPALYQILNAFAIERLSMYTSLECMVTLCTATTQLLAFITGLILCYFVVVDFGSNPEYLSTLPPSLFQFINSLFDS